ncbi:MAG TPA: hypothetical protein VF229_05700 [Burkholderiaceae bacterium]
MNLFDLDERVTAAAVAAAGTVIGALIQLRAAWRKEVSERARGVPVTKKSRRGPVTAVFLLVVAAGVAGFAFSQYLMRQADGESAALRGELRTQLAQITATAERLERATLPDHGPAGRGDGRREAESVTVTSTAIVGPCRARAAGAAAAAATAAAAADATAPCSEQDAVRVTLCASVPSSAVVAATTLYARPDNSTQPWADSRATPGQEIGRARFAEKPFERVESDQTKQICTGFSAWDSDQPTIARVALTYLAAPQAREVAHAVVVPTSALGQ